MKCCFWLLQAGTGPSSTYQRHSLIHPSSSCSSRPRPKPSPSTDLSCSLPAQHCMQAQPVLQVRPRLALAHSMAAHCMLHLSAFSSYMVAFASTYAALPSFSCPAGSAGPAVDAFAVLRSAQAAQVPMEAELFLQAGADGSLSCYWRLAGV